MTVPGFTGQAAQDSLTGLRGRLAEALGEAGIVVHDCDGPGRSRGGCCLTITSGRDDYPAGVIAAWTCADSLSDGGVGGDRSAAYRTVQETMSEALWAIVEAFGFVAQPFGNYSLPLVTALPPPAERTPRPWDVDDLGEAADVKTEPLYGEPLPAVEIDATRRLDRPCAICGSPQERLHWPQARTSAGVCCACFDGRTLIADDTHPEGHWIDLGRCAHSLGR